MSGTDTEQSDGAAFAFDDLFLRFGDLFDFRPEGSGVSALPEPDLAADDVADLVEV